MRRTDYAFPVVGIGASAGGVEALIAFFDAVPSDGGMAFVVVLYPDTGKAGGLVELLGRHTGMRITQAADGAKLEPDHVYVLPPDRYLTIEGDRIRLFEPKEPRTRRRPVDALFRELGGKLRERAICIVLSGTGSNGAASLRVLKVEGGIAMAQDPATARYSGMPQSAIDTGLVDFVLPIDGLATALADYAQHARVPSPEEAEAVVQNNREEIGKILSLILARVGFDFRHYKKSTLTRRIHRRMGLRHVIGLADYHALLQHDASEVRALVDDLLISVSGFFRDSEAWTALEQRVISPLVCARKPSEPVRIWVLGCATGEEAYSMAILLAEQAEAARKTLDVKIFATDASERAIDLARQGVYPASIDADVSHERLQKYFEKRSEVYRIKKSIRDQIVFAPQNILRDPPFSRLDLVSCRNLLIYLEPDVQKKILRLFHFALRPDGHLLLGTAENVAGSEDLFVPLSKKWRIYRRPDAVRHADVEVPLGARGDPVAARAPDAWASRRPAASLADRVRQTLAERFGPASVVVDRKLRVLYVHGPTEDYLTLPAGEPTRDLLVMAREGLRAKLRAALRQMFERRQPVSVEAVVQHNGRFRPIAVDVVPFSLDGEHETGALVVFEHVARGAKVGDAVRPQALAEGDDSEDELKAIRAELQSTIEELETSNEELKASNQEITSMNEELQSTNEELETSKEELQSLNEELNTVNNQLHEKVVELEQTTNNVSNLLASTDIATIFLDRELRIRWFTPATRALLDLLPRDIGRPIGHFAQKFRDGDLSENARQVLETLTPIEGEVRAGANRWYTRRILPYRTEDGRVDGVVATFTEITRRKEAERRQRLLVAELRHRVRNILATVRSIVRETAENKETVEDFTEAFDARLDSLARVQSLISENVESEVELDALVREELLAHALQEGDSLAVEGPDVILRPRAAQMLAMALNELATNAIKYGALSAHEGRLAISWSVHGRPGDRRLVFRWLEQGIPVRGPPSERGFGLELIERGLPYSLGGTAQFEIARRKVTCVIEIPASGNLAAVAGQRLDDGEERAGA